MIEPDGWNYFSAGSMAHVAILILFGLTVTAIVTTARRLEGTDLLRRLERAMVAVLALLAVGEVVHDAIPLTQWHVSLPLNICDVAAMVAPLALGLGWRPLRAWLHYWALLLTPQAFLMPGLSLGPAHGAFWSFFIGHGAPIGAALYDCLVRGYRPTWADLRVGVLVSVAYAAIIFPLNVWTGWDYGFLGDSSHTPDAVAFFGEWPGRVPLLLLTLWGVMAAMTLAWELVRAWPRLTQAFQRSSQRPQQTEAA